MRTPRRYGYPGSLGDGRWQPRWEGARHLPTGLDIRLDSGQL
jgi:hypothetical protein